MDVPSILITIILLHAAVYFIDQFLKSCLNLPYIYFLENTGLSVKPFRLNWFTTVFNRPITKWAVWRPRLLRAWFSIGAVVVCLLIVPSIGLLVAGLVTSMQFGSEKEKAEHLLQLVIPGITFPVNDLPYYFITILMASVIHEAGHAIAAIKEDVHVNGFGLVFMFILPGAYVDVPTEEIRSLSPFRQLKILCAGVWHNLVLTLVALGLGLAAPYLLMPLYFHGNGISVISLDHDSPARGPTGLEEGDVITQLNSCPVANLDDWQRCLVQAVTTEQIGFCVPENVVHTYDETIHHAFEGADGSVQCCSGDSETHLCFALQEESDSDSAAMHPFSCLPARTAIAHSTQTCISSPSCPASTHCLAPSLRNTSRLLRILRHGTFGDTKEDVLYLGPPAHLYHTLIFSDYIPKISVAPLTWPNMLQTMCDYVIKFSGALAVLNVVPCIYLDGYWITGALIDLFMSKRFEQVTCKVVHIISMLLGSLLLIANIIIGLRSIV
ncbi:membrane-bound transcription factor site-2 protease isoform X2 [Oratosquilla oratoria]|uniref:membrane-bound transcription factor site-2 protease isoform X2 n=1 Tax=Oratosquilla oratoria TaxID=337810 RepID=UPI003F761AFF